MDYWRIGTTDAPTLRRVFSAGSEKILATNSIRQPGTGSMCNMKLNPGYREPLIQKMLNKHHNLLWC